MPNQISATLLVIPNCWVFLHHYAEAKCLSHRVVYFEENVSCKRVSGRTVQLDEIIESSSLDQRKETLEVIPEFPTATDTEAST